MPTRFVLECPGREQALRAEPHLHGRHYICALRRPQFLDGHDDEEWHQRGGEDRQPRGIDVERSQPHRVLECVEHEKRRADGAKPVRFLHDDLLRLKRHIRRRVAAERRDHRGHVARPCAERVAERALQKRLFACGDALVVDEAQQHHDERQVPRAREQRAPERDERVRHVQRMPHHRVRAARRQRVRRRAPRSARRCALRRRADDKRAQRSPLSATAKHATSHANGVGRRSSNTLSTKSGTSRRGM